MLDTLLPTADQKFEIVPRRIEVPFGEGDGSLVRLSLPPVEELLAIRALPAEQVSLNQVADSAEGFYTTLFTDEAARLAKKAVQFAHSHVFRARLASLKELAGDLMGAQAELQAAVQIETAPYVQLKLGINLFKQKRFAEAKKAFSVEGLKDSVDAALRLALLAIVQGDFEEAKQHAGHATNRNPLDYRARLFAGALCLASSEFELAIRHFRVAAEENPTSALVLVNLAVAHVCTGRPAKALRELRTAVRLNPISANAIAFLADLAFTQGVNTEAISPLEAFIKYEQKMPGMWARLARAYYHSNDLDKAIKALRHEASLRDSASVWNNIGVCIWNKGDVAKAVQTFKYALDRGEVEGGTGRESALLNVLGALAQQSKYEEVFKVSEEAIATEGITKFASDSSLYRVCVHNLLSLARCKRYDEFEARSEQLLTKDFLVHRLRKGILANLIHHWTTVRPNYLKAAVHANTVFELSARHAVSEDREQYMAVNNAAFAFILLGELEKAEVLLQKLNKLIHVIPYPTATLGYLHFAKGHLERGTALYKEAMELLRDNQLRRQFAQKLNLETAHYWMRAGQFDEARKYATLVLQVKDGVPAFLTDAERLMARLH